MTQKEFVEMCATAEYDDVVNAIDSGIDPDEPAIIKGIPASAMFIAASAGNLKAVQALLHRRAKSADGYVAAVVSGNNRVLWYIANRVPEEIDDLDSNGTNALLTATTMKKPDVVEDLLATWEADPDAESAGGHTALTYAAMMAAHAKEEGSTDTEDIFRIAALLVEYGADCHEAMMIAVKAGLEDFAEALVDAGGFFDVNFQDGEGRSLLMLSVMSGGGPLKLLLANGAKPDLPDKKGRTRLMVAAIDTENGPAMIDILLRYGADINAHDNRGITPLMWSVVNTDNTPGVLLPALIRTGGVRAEGWKQWSAFISLYTAAKRELQLDMIRRLIKEGADVNATDRKGMNALMFALMEGDDEVADILTEAGASINFDMK